MSCNFISKTNFVHKDVINLASASSETTNFESDNLYNSQQRSMVWRSGGCYLLDSTNNVAIFRESTGVDLTATVTEGKYTSHTAFASAVKAALEAAGGSTYTVEQDSATSKWKITSDGAGGGGIFELMWTNASSAGLAGVMGYSTGSDDTGGLVYTADILRIHTEEWLEWDLGIASLPSLFAVFGDRNAPIELSPSATIELQGNFTDTWTTQVFTKTIPYNSDVLYHHDSTGFGSSYLRYWRMRIVDSDNSNGYVQLGYAFLGNTITPSRGGIPFPFEHSQDDLTETITAVGGQVYGAARAKSDEFVMNWGNLKIADKELFDLHFENNGIHTPFVVSLDPKTVMSSSAEYWVRLVRYTERPRAILSRPGVWNVSMRVREAL